MRDVMMHAGPFTVLPQSVQPQAAQAGQVDEDEAGEPAEAGASGAAPGGSGSTAVTHLAPPGLRGSLEHTTKAFPLAFGLFETFLGAKFPYPALHQVLPASCLIFTGLHTGCLHHQEGQGTVANPPCLA